MAQRGWSLSEMEIRRIADLLSETDLAVASIAERMGCSKSAIMSVNRRFQIRDYGKASEYMECTVGDSGRTP